MPHHVEIIAEVGNSHEGSLGLAKCCIKAAADAGVDTVKFQTHIFDAESLPDAPNPPYFKDESRKEYFDRTAFDEAGWRKLKEYAEQECGVRFLSSPFSLEAVDLLEAVGVERYKIPSGEVSNIPYLIRLGETGKPVLLSSGMSRWEELDAAVETLKTHGCPEIVLLQCTSRYPCPPEQAGLNNIALLRERYGLPVGFSDHTQGPAVAVVALTLGAVAVEKHFVLSKRMYGPDAPFSAEPDELAELVAQLRDAEKALQASVDKDAMAADLSGMKEVFEKSIVTARALQAGTTLTLDDLRFKKPGDGVPASRYEAFLGKTMTCDVPANVRLQWDMVR